MKLLIDSSVLSFCLLLVYVYTYLGSDHSSRARSIYYSRELPLPRGTAVARTSIEEDVLLLHYSFFFFLFLPRVSGIEILYSIFRITHLTATTVIFLISFNACCVFSTAVATRFRFSNASEYISSLKNFALNVFLKLLNS